ncbi:hypothetical protein [Rhodohalobacter sp. 8-1]|uniref:hypothetical protein n=1 Tax=Rhodohalobacter sp. 8-1 TaxID=3131972 RepID=UPI0030EE1A13
MKILLGRSASQFKAGLIAGFIILLVSSPLYAQTQPDPRGSFLRSLAIPGWGHYYNDSNNWTRGKVHLGADIIMIGSYFGLNARASNLEGQYHTFAQLNAGVSISDRSRKFQLAISQYNNLEAYNDFQLRSRNWDQLLDDTRENRWQWESEEDRERYSDLRETSDRARNQLPAIAGLMVVNRVLSAISAYRQARDMTSGPELTLLPAFNDRLHSGIIANLSFKF